MRHIFQYVHPQVIVKFKSLGISVGQRSSVNLCNKIDTLWLNGCMNIILQKINKEIQESRWIFQVYYFDPGRKSINWSAISLYLIR